MPFRKLFLSRWSALLWAAGIVWLAVDTVGFAPSPRPAQRADGRTDDDKSDAGGNTGVDDDLAILANAMSGH